MERCKSACGGEHCELPAGHKGKHREGGCSWSNEGLERANAELAEANLANAVSAINKRKKVSNHRPDRSMSALIGQR